MKGTQQNLAGVLVLEVVVLLVAAWVLPRIIDPLAALFVMGAVGRVVWFLTTR